MCLGPIQPGEVFLAEEPVGKVRELLLESCKAYVAQIYESSQAAL